MTVSPQYAPTFGQAPLKRRLGKPGGRPISPLRGVDWSLGFGAFLFYVMAIITQRAPIGSVAITVALVALLFERKGFRLPAPLAWVFALVAWSSVGLLLTDYAEKVTTANSEFGKVAAISCVLVNVLTSRSRLRLYLLAVTVFFVIYPLRGTLVYYFIVGETKGGRAIWNGMYQNPNDLAGLCLLQFSIVLGMLEVERAKWVRLFAGACAVVIPFVILLTQSRGVMIASTVFILVTLKKYYRDVKKMSMGAVLVAGVAFAAPDSVWVRLTTFGDELDEATGMLESTDAGSSTEGRMEIWKVASEVIAENPFGVGLGAYGEAHYQIWKRGGYNSGAAGKRDTHSTYIKIFAERGFPGLFLFLMILISVARYAQKTRKKYAAVAPADVRQLFWIELGMYAYLVASIWGSYDQWVPTYLYLLLVYCTARLLEEEYGKPQVHRRASNQAFQHQAAPQSA